MNQKMKEINSLAKSVKEGTLSRERRLADTLKLAEKFYDASADLMSNLRDLKENIYSQEPPGVDPPTIKEQQIELAVR